MGIGWHSVSKEKKRSSSKILSKWHQESGRKKTFLFNEYMNRLPPAAKAFKEPTFKSWFSRGKMIQALDNEVRGERVVQLVKLFHEDERFGKRILQADDLREFIDLYFDLPPKYILQLERILEEIRQDAGIIEFVPSWNLEVDWKNQFQSAPTFSYVMDDLWCIRARTAYSIELQHQDVTEAVSWHWWHRMSAGGNGLTHFSEGSPALAIRGSYADDYYLYQMRRFQQAVERSQVHNPDRCDSLIELLNSTDGFESLWTQASDATSHNNILSSHVTVPFFRKDGTFFWLLEVTMRIPGTENLFQVAWIAMDADTQEYLADLRRTVDQKIPDKYDRPIFFIDDFEDEIDSHHFSILNS